MSRADKRREVIEISSDENQEVNSPRMLSDDEMIIDSDSKHERGSILLDLTGSSPRSDSPTSSSSNSDSEGRVRGIWIYRTNPDNRQERFLFPCDASSSAAPDIPPPGSEAAKKRRIRRNAQRRKSNAARPVVHISQGVVEAWVASLTAYRDSLQQPTEEQVQHIISVINDLDRNRDAIPERMVRHFMLPILIRTFRHQRTYAGFSSDGARDKARALFDFWKLYRKEDVDPISPVE